MTIFSFYLLDHKTFDNKNSIEKPGTIEALEKRLYEISRLENNHEFEKIYDEYFSPETKDRLQKDAYINTLKNAFIDKIYSSEITINDIIIKENIGYVDRTRIDCLDEKCIEKKQTRGYRKYIYANNNWYMIAGDDQIYCIRDAGYDIPEEFKRAISLIIQRYNQSDNAEAQSNGVSVKDIQNCLNIQYAKPSDDISDAYGAFIFSPSQSMEKFDILVSPGYSAKDDILTAILLTHEFRHVLDFIEGQFSGEQVDCFETEARAFSAQNLFFSQALNKEEVYSLVSRMLTNASEETKQIEYVIEEIAKTKGKDYHEKALNFVKASPAYQEQCKDMQ